jgi:guanylate kinase
MSTPASEQDRGRLIVLAAPSGAGKTTLVHALLQRTPELSFSISYTTRPRRVTETDGEDYFFVDEATFQKMVDDDAFLEHATVYDYSYGTGRAHVEALLDAGRTVLLEIDWQGARQVMGRIDDAVSVFIMPPGVDELESRLRGRATDSDSTIARRLSDALSDMSHWSEFSYVVFNYNLDEAADILARIVGGQGTAHASTQPAVRRRAESVLAV